MANLTLELRINSATDLSKVNIITKMDVYAVVSIHGDQAQKKHQAKTLVDRTGGSNPTWDHPVKFSVNEQLARDGRLTLVVKLICDRVLGDKDIGEVNVPVLELLKSNPPSSDGDGNANGMKFVMYQVKTPSGRGKGSLRFSYRFDTAPFKSDPPAPFYQNPLKSDLPSTVYPPPPAPVYTNGPPEPYAYQPQSQPYGYAPPPPGKPKPDSLYPDPGKLGEPVTAYPAPAAGPSWGPPPPHQPYAYPPSTDKPGHAYPYPPPPPQQGYAYAEPPQPGYAYAEPPPQPSYGYGYPPPPSGYGYGYPPPQQPVRPPKNNRAGLGFGAGLLGGALGGLLLGDVVSDVADIGFDF